MAMSMSMFINKNRNVRLTGIELIVFSNLFKLNLNQMMLSFICSCRTDKTKGVRARQLCRHDMFLFWFMLVLIDMIPTNIYLYTHTQHSKYNLPSENEWENQCRHIGCFHLKTFFLKNLLTL